MIDDAIYTRIRRLFFGEHWKVGTITAQLDVHPDAVRRAIDSQAFNSKRPGPTQEALAAPYRDFIKEQLDLYPTLRATRVQGMIKARGYKGGYAPVRRLVKILRPVGAGAAYLRLHTLPGEQAQVDWGHFGHLHIGQVKRPLSCFVMVLAHSRALYARFFLDQTLSSFLLGHVLAFEALGGAPRQILYDNLKAAVVERNGDLIRYNPQLLELCAHYHFQPRACAPRRGNEKGKVERKIQDIRHSFFDGRPLSTLEQLNAQLGQWIKEVAHARTVPGDEARRCVQTVWEAEREHLLTLPEHPFGTDHIRAVASGKTPYIRYDLNDYSIPHTLVRTPLTLSASQTLVRLIDAAGQVVGKHTRCFGRAQLIEDPAHLKGLTEYKRRARPLRGRDRLRRACSHADAFLLALAQRAHDNDDNFRPYVQHLGLLLDRFGPTALNAALGQSLLCGALSPASVETLLEQQRLRKKRPPAIPLALPQDCRVRDLRVLCHDLSPYDALTTLHFPLKKEDPHEPR
jgi:transposase